MPVLSTTPVPFGFEVFPTNGDGQVPVTVRLTYRAWFGNVPVFTTTEYEWATSASPVNFFESTVPTAVLAAYTAAGYEYP